VVTRYGRWGAGTAAGCLFLFTALFVALFVADPLAFFVGDPTTFRGLLVVSGVGAAASVATVVFAGLAWRDRAWGPWSRIYYSLVAFAAVATTLVLAYWNLLWYQY